MSRSLCSQMSVNPEAEPGWARVRSLLLHGHVSRSCDGIRPISGRAVPATAPCADVRISRENRQGSLFHSRKLEIAHSAKTVLLLESASMLGMFAFWPAIVALLSELSWLSVTFSILAIKHLTITELIVWAKTSSLCMILCSVLGQSSVQTVSSCQINNLTFLLMFKFLYKPFLKRRGGEKVQCQ